MGVGDSMSCFYHHVISLIISVAYFAILNIYIYHVETYLTQWTVLQIKELILQKGKIMFVGSSSKTSVTRG